MIRHERLFHAIQHSNFHNTFIRYKHGEFRTHFLEPFGNMIFQRFTVFLEQFTLPPFIHPARHQKFPLLYR